MAHPVHYPVILALLVLAPAAPAAGEGPASAALVELEPGGEPSLSALLQGNVAQPMRLVDLSLEELIEGSWGPWGITQPAQLVPCEAAPRSPSELEAELEAVEAKLFELDYEGADEGLHALRDSLCGCSRPLPTPLVPRILYLEGIVHFYMGDRESARDLFGLAAQRQPGIEWDLTFPPDAQQVFLQGLADAVRVAGVHLTPPAADPPAAVHVDGHPVPPEGIRIAPGRHALQIEDSGGAVRGAWLEVDATGQAALMGAADLTDRLRGGPLEEGADAAALLVAAAIRGGHAAVLLVSDPTRGGGWWWDRDSGEWSAVPLLDNPGLRRARRQQAAGAGLLGAGVARAAGGTALAVVQRNAAAELRPQMESSAALYDLWIEDYRGHRTGTGVGLGMVAAGGACLVSGVVLLARGTAERRDPGNQPRRGLLFTPAGGWFAIEGRW